METEGVGADMSMISAQCDELRKRAKALVNLSPWFDGPKDAKLMERAADTIWELRCKMADMVDQREEVEWLKAENAKLRAERDEWHRVAVSKQDIIDHTRDARAENAKLRELCKDIWNDALCFEGFWDYVHDDGTIYREDELPHYQERMRECGIEVK